MVGAVPDKLDEVTTSLQGTNLRISWTVTANDHSLTVSSYKILVKDADSSTYTEHASCDGSDGTTISNMYCEIAMTEFSASPYNYDVAELIVAHVQA
jgi:hypothetical protein